MDVSSSLLLPSPVEDLRLTAGEVSRLSDKSLRTGVECAGVAVLSRDSKVSLTYSSGISSGIELPWERVFMSTSGMELSCDFSERSRDLSRADTLTSSGTELSLALRSWPRDPETLMDSLILSVRWGDRPLSLTLLERLLDAEGLADPRPLRSVERATDQEILKEKLVQSQLIIRSWHRHIRFNSQTRHKWLQCHKQWNVKLLCIRLLTKTAKLWSLQFFNHSIWELLILDDTADRRKLVLQKILTSISQ